MKIQGGPSHWLISIPLYFDMLYLTVDMLNLFEEKYTYLHFLSFLNTEMAQEVEILANGRQGLVCITQSIAWMLMAW